MNRRKDQMRYLLSTPRKSLDSSREETSIHRSNRDYYGIEGEYTSKSSLYPGLEQKGGTRIKVDSLEGLDLAGVTSLTFGQFFDQKVERLDLKGVTSLTFGKHFNQPVEGLDLKRVKTLTFGKHFNQPVEGLDLKGVKTLKFGQGFNQKVERLDLKGVTFLTFGDDFNQLVDRLDLKGVTFLTFGWKFNQPVEGLDLKGVKFLTFNGDMPIEGLDLKGVKTLKFGAGYNQKVEGLDLKGVETLAFGFHFNQPVERLDLKGVESLHFGFLFNQKVEGLDLKGVTTLEFGENFNQSIGGGFLKEGLESLRVGGLFLQEISDGVFPMSLERLESSVNFFRHPQKASLINGGWKKFKRDLLIWRPVNAKYSLDLERFCNTLSHFHIVNIRHILDYFGIDYSKTESRETLCNRLRETISPYRDEPLVTSSDLESCDNTEDIILTEQLEGQPRSRLVRLERRDSRGNRLPDGCFLKDGLRRWLMANPNCYRNGQFNYEGCVDPYQQRIPVDILDQIFSYDEKDNLRFRYANDRDQIDII